MLQPSPATPFWNPSTIMSALALTVSVIGTFVVPIIKWKYGKVKSKPRLRLEHLSQTLEGTEETRVAFTVRIHHEGGEPVYLEQVQLLVVTPDKLADFWREKTHPDWLFDTKPMDYESGPTGSTPLKKGETSVFKRIFNAKQPWELTTSYKFARLDILSQGKVFLSEDESPKLATMRDEFIVERRVRKWRIQDHPGFIDTDAMEKGAEPTQQF